MTHMLAQCVYIMKDYSVLDYRFSKYDLYNV
jgi:hypothetical protein